MWSKSGKQEKRQEYAKTLTHPQSHHLPAVFAMHWGKKQMFSIRVQKYKSEAATETLQRLQEETHPDKKEHSSKVKK